MRGIAKYRVVERNVSTYDTYCKYSLEQKTRWGKWRSILWEDNKGCIDAALDKLTGDPSATYYDEYGNRLSGDTKEPTRCHLWTGFWMGVAVAVWLGALSFTAITLHG